MSTITKEQLIEDLKASTQNASGMFEISDDTICALMSMLAATPATVSVPLAIHGEDFEKALSVLNDTLDDCGDSERGLLLALDKAGIEVRSDACRAAMLQGAENAESRSTIQTAPALDSSPKIAESTSGNSPVIPDGWVACSERMPETMVSVLVTGTWFHHAVAFWDGLSWCDLDFEPPVTHWMPLPAAPQQEDL
ncbi:DUF551 domain-containing protein [Enterobacter roggenkampii]|uniref:DUF551 domain-containing protein n=1 Tax=Enterobacter roggenkampii TaxID=1812935 RepID=UPI0020058758|nr:DUF551 domain-containing protein [Enterobacter roggenkampii]MCK7230942.1 DUF551 domain-containing protein [Enterobacter roggenkampii]